MALALGIVALGVPSPSRANDFPSRLIRVIVPFPAGGTMDVAARVTSEHLSQQLRQPIIVDNRGGANGVIGTDAVAKAAPDGYTLLEVTGSFVVNASVRRKLPYDPLGDFVPVTEMGRSSGYLLLVHPSVPARNVQELIEGSRAPNTNWYYSSPGIGNTMHLAAEIFKMKTGAVLTHVPYRGVAPAVAGLVGGEVQMTIMPPLVGLEHVRGGTLKALAFTGPARWSELPDVPTMAEAGYPELVIDAGWFGLFAPAGTPAPVVDRLYAEMRKVLAIPKVADTLRKGGYEPQGSTPAEFSRFVQSELQRYADIVKAAKIEPE
jgi:tripartite-type tricarboxylate transporter receptor subunit TctC